MGEKINFKTKYGHRFYNHFQRFIKGHQLIDMDKTQLLSVSGGVDSMVLLHLYLFLKKSYNISLEVIHFDHSTQRKSEAIRLYLDKICELNQIPLHMRKKSFKDISSNFEQKARQWRKVEYKSFKDYQIVQAHHINDSFEWHLMNQFKNSSTKQLGIPLVNNNLYRPFHCFSKKHIVRFAKLETVTHFNDESNEDINFERNYMRNVIIPKIESRYPKYLKHFVQRQNQLAERFHFNAKKYCSHSHSQHDFLVKKFPDHGLHVIQTKNNLPFMKKNHLLLDSIKEGIKTLSLSDRGVVHKEILKLFNAYKSGARGPMNFSGGVLVFIFKETLVLVQKNKLNQLDYYLSEKNMTQTDNFPFTFIANDSCQASIPVKQTYKEISHFLPKTQNKNKVALFGIRDYFHGLN